MVFNVIIPMVVWVVALVVVFLLIDKTSTFHKAWEKYEGSIITGVKLAEKAISDDTPNAGLRRLDEAMKFVLSNYATENNGSQPPAALQQQIKEGIQIKHAELERLGNLRST